MKKVAFLITCMSIGGAEKVLIDLVNKLNKDKYDCTVILVYKNNIYDNGNLKFTKNFEPNIRVKYMCNNNNKFIYILFNWLLNNIPNKYLHRLFIGNKYDVEIGFSEGLPTQIISSSTNKKSKKIAWLHTDAINRTKNFSSDEINKEKVVYSKFNNIVAVSKCVAQSFNNLHNNFKKIDVKYNPIDVNNIYNKSMEKVSFSSNEMIKFIAIGRLTQVKGYERLIKVLNDIYNEGFKFELYIIGDGELRDVLKEQINKYKLNKSIILVGFESNPYKYLSKADSLICSSFIEGYSTVVLESIILNKPVITTRCNGMEELFGNYDCGIICDNSEEGLYNGIKKVLLSPKLLEKFSKQCNKRAKELRENKIIEEIEEII